MAKTIDATKKLIFTITNSYVADEADVLADQTADKKFNTGLASVAGGTAVIEDAQAWVAKHIASIRLFGGNSYVYLEPGDTLKLVATRTAEIAYYTEMKDELLTIESEEVEEATE